MSFKGLEDLEIQALVDRELDDAAEKRVRAAIAESPALQKKYNQLLIQKQLLIEWFKEESEETEKSRSSARGAAPAFLH
jgi:hypothetical protein